jgi:DNA polymerase-1
MPDTLYLVDTFSLVFQVYYAIRQPMTGTRGQPTNAVYGFTGDISHLLKEKHPTHLICAMESGAPAERVSLYSDYKVHREEMPNDLLPQIPLILDLLAAYNIPCVSADGWEADDVIATLATQAAAAGMDVRIVSSDKDLRQLIGPRVKLYSIRKRQYFDETELMQEWGVRPDQVIDFQSLVGDSVDNVPGVPGVGPKRASELLHHFGTLEGVLANADRAPGKKLAENLRTFADQARLSQKLVTLRTDLPLAIDWDQARVQPPDYDRLYELFSDFGFRRYADEARQNRPTTPIKEARDSDRKWEVISSPARFEKFVDELRGQPSFCVDLETTSTEPTLADIVGWAFCWQPHRSFYVPVDGPPGSETLPGADVVAALKPILEDPEREIVNQNVKYDMLVLRRAGIRVRNVGVDPMIADYLLEAGARTHGLDELAQRHLNRKMIPITELIGSGKQQLKMFEVDVARAAEYASEDADIAWQLAHLLAERLRQKGLWELYWNLERPLIPVLAEMEWHGIRVDVDELQRQSVELGVRLDALMHEIYDIAGHEFNIGSPKQLARVLFEELKLPVIKRTKTGPSTNEEVLEKLAARHELPARIMEHRSLSKLKGTYLDALPKLVNPHTGRVHTSFSQVSAATGRLASSEPNLQNIPIRTPEGSRIRRAFLPAAPGWKLICLDYSQIELRMLAHFCQDAALLEAFRLGEDIHRAVAADVFNVPRSDVTAAQRRIAKAVNFGVIYGQTPYGLSELLKIDESDAAEFIDGYFARYSGVNEFISQTLEQCRRRGYAETLLGRRREIDGIRPRRFRNLNLPERTAVNTVIQGSAADLIKQAMIHVHARMQLSGTPGRLLLQIHDELVFEAPADEVAALAEMARHEMETAIALDVPIEVDVKIGDNWFDAGK